MAPVVKYSHLSGGSVAEAQRFRPRGPIPHPTEVRDGTSQLLRVLDYRLNIGLRRQRSGYLSVVLLVALIGILLEIPHGIVAGCELWSVFARSISAVPEPTVPVLSVILISLAALGLANVVSALPGLRAARTPTAEVLRGE